MTDTLVVRGLGVERDGRPVLSGVDLDVAPREVRALMGVSGVGKSTVLRALVALEPLHAGTVAVGDFVLRPGPVAPESRLKPLRRRIGMVFQAPSLFEHLTVIENVTLAPVHALGWSSQQAREVALRLLSGLGVAHRAEAMPRQLSGGEAQRVAIARALAPDPKLLLMDEPTSALDPARRGALGETLRRLAAEGRGLLIATHDTEFARSYADRIAVLWDGCIVEEGPAEAVLSAPSHQATRELLRHRDEQAGAR